MAQRSKTRESRSVRLHPEEWVLAEAIARLNFPAASPSAGLGLRDALQREATRLRRSGRGMALEAHMDQIMREHAERDR